MNYWVCNKGHMTEILWFPVEENPEADFQVVCLLSRKVKFPLSSFANVPCYLEDQENKNVMTLRGLKITWPFEPWVNLILLPFSRFYREAQMARIDLDSSRGLLPHKKKRKRENRTVLGIVFQGIFIDPSAWELPLILLLLRPVYKALFPLPVYPVTKGIRR